MVVLGSQNPGGGRHDEPWILERPRRLWLARIREALRRWLAKARSHREEKRWE